MLECRDRARELADALELVASDSDARGLLGALQSPGEALLPARAGEGAQRDLELGPEVVQLPAQIVDQRGALLDEPFAVIDEQPDIELGPSELRDRQRLNALADRRAGDRDRVDAIRLARLAGAVSRAGHQLRRDTHDAFAAREQEPLQRPRDMPAILKRPHPLTADAARPAQQLTERATRRGDRHVAQRPARRLADGRERVRALVRVRPDHDHLHRPLIGIDNEPIPGGHISVGAMPRSYQVTPGILGQRRATQPKKVRPTADSMDRGQPAADREPSRPRRTPPPDAPRLSLTWIRGEHWRAGASAPSRRLRKRRPEWECGAAGVGAPMLCLCTTLGQDGLTARLLVVRLGTVACDEQRFCFLT